MPSDRFWISLLAHVCGSFTVLLQSVVLSLLCTSVNVELCYDYAAAILLSDCLPKADVGHVGQQTCWWIPCSKATIRGTADMLVDPLF